MNMNWLKFGSLAAPYVATWLISVLTVIIAFRVYVAPDITKTLEEAGATITKLAQLSGMKSQEYKDARGIEKLVGADLIKEKLPELEALRLVLSPSTWEEIETTIEENPEAVIQLYEKYGHLLPGAQAAQTQEKYMF